MLMSQFLVDIGVPVSVGCLMFLIGVTAGQEPWPRRAQLRSLAFGTVSQFLALPVLAVGIILVLRPDPLAATATALLAFAPAGTLSNYFTLINRGRIALSICLTAAGTLLYATAFPLLAAFLHLVVDAEIAGLSLFAVARDLGATILVPVLVGAVVGRRFPDLIAHHRGRMEMVASFLVLPLLALSLWVGWSDLSASFLPIMVVSAVFTLGALAVGTLTGRLVVAEDRTTVAIECATRNVPVVVILSDGVLAPSAALGAATGIFLCQTAIVFTFSLATRHARVDHHAAPPRGAEGPG